MATSILHKRRDGSDILAGDLTAGEIGLRIDNGNEKAYFRGTSNLIELAKATDIGEHTVTLTGDITGSGTTTSGTVSFVTALAAGSVDYANIQDTTATDVLLGRSTAGAGTVEEIACTPFARTVLDDADAAAARTTLELGTADSPTFTSLTLSGDLTVSGTTTTINTSTLVVEDHNIELGKVTTPDNSTADGGGITLNGGVDGDKLFRWLSGGTSWTSSEDLDLALGKVYRINGSEVLSATALGSTVVDSSLTSVGIVTTGTIDGGLLP